MLHTGSLFPLDSGVCVPFIALLNMFVVEIEKTECLYSVCLLVRMSCTCQILQTTFVFDEAIRQFQNLYPANLHI